MISAYTTTRNCKEMDYPFLESIQSMLSFADEVCVLDSSDKDDGTLVELEKFARKNSAVKLKHEDINWKAPNHGIFDGQTKQMARKMCNGVFCWQQDADEIVHERHAPLIESIISKINWKETPVLALPVIEFWGPNKVRIDVNFWKWRLTLNKKEIIHGIPNGFSIIDPKTGLEFAKPGTDTCDYIHETTKTHLPMASFVNEETERLRVLAYQGNEAALREYRIWYNNIVNSLPGVYHYSWYNIERKIKQYKLFWTDFWKSMYNMDKNERDNPFFPGKLWSEVTDEEIKSKAQELEEKTSGWVFHKPWNGSKTFGLETKDLMDHPQVIKNWLNLNVK